MLIMLIPLWAGKINLIVYDKHVQFSVLHCRELQIAELNNLGNAYSEIMLFIISL